MKHSLTPRSHRRAGFTLVELLVVIGIIAILATAILAGSSAAINAAKRLKAQNTGSQIQTAVINYYTEYSVYPVPTAGSPADTYYDNKTAGSDTGGWENLIYTLCGNINPITSNAVTDTGLNTRNIAFLSPSRADLATPSGIPKNPFTPAADASAEYYFIAIDADYSNLTGDSGAASGKIPDFVASSGKTVLSYIPATGIPQGVCVWSNTSDTPYTGGMMVHPQFWSHTY